MVNDTLSYLGVEVSEMDADRLKELIGWELGLQRKDSRAIGKIADHTRKSLERQMVLQQELTKRKYTHVPAFSFQPIKRSIHFFVGE